MTTTFEVMEMSDNQEWATPRSSEPAAGSVPSAAAPGPSQSEPQAAGPGQPQGAGPSQNAGPGQPYAGGPYAGLPYGGPPYGGGPYHPQPPYAGGPYGQFGQRPPRRRGRSVVAGVAVAAIAVGAVAFGIERSQASSGDQATSAAGGTSSSGTGWTPRYRWNLPYGSGNGDDQSGSGTGSGSGTSTSTTAATTAQQVGVVDVNTVVDFGAARAAGTGLVLTSSGEILTNNHVVAESTSISVTVVSTGKTYAATVVGTDPTDDIAVLQLKNASGLATATLGDSSAVGVGDAVTAVGNAGGTGGTPSAATGTVTALDQAITATDENGSNPESLTGLIQTNANVEPGDSGGPLYGKDGTVIGIDTAAETASADSPISTADTAAAFAIPIAKATSIAAAIESGSASSTIHLGYPAFLGVELQPTTQYGSTGGALVSGVISGTAAAGAGLQAGDTITAVGGTTISSSAALSTALAKYRPGQRVAIHWLDASGRSHSATVTLTAGPVD